MSVNIDHPNEDISTSAGSPPSLGSQAPLVANNATVTANSDGNVARWVMRTAGGGTANYWCKIADITFTAISNISRSLSLQVKSNNTVISPEAIIDVFAVQGTTGLDSTLSFINVRELNDSAIASTSFMLTASASTNGTTVELWMQTIAGSANYSIIELSSSDTLSISYNPDAAWTATTPTGAVTITSDWAKPTRVAWTPVVEGQTTAGTATYVNQLGYYWEKDGFIEFALQLNWNTHTGTGNMIITGLPKINASGIAISLAVGNSTITTTQTTAFILNSQDFIRVQDGGAALAVQASGQLSITGRYAV